MARLGEVQQAVERVAANAGATVVRIGRGAGRGAGVLIGDGAVLTNAHNLRGSETTVTFADGRVETGAVAGVDLDADLAVVRAAGAGDGASGLEWHAGEVRLGSTVLTLTLPAGGGVRVTVGTVSSVGATFRGPRGRLVHGGIEHTAPLSRGSSGSPVLDPDGRLVGLNTHRLGEGFYLAVAAGAELRERADALARGESPRRPYLGVALLPPRAARRLRAAVGLPERDGLLVRDVDEDGPAARAGVRPGDLLVEAGGRALGSPDELYEALAAVAEGGELPLHVVRGSEELDVVVNFAGDGGARPGGA
ncbi:MAG TPA: S1C family serine protease [Acidimicrobiales bacterium]|nr:S1C family serine protease [Acidimicrobiales bacterium]